MSYASSSSFSNVDMKLLITTCGCGEVANVFVVSVSLSVCVSMCPFGI